MNYDPKLERVNLLVKSGKFAEAEEICAAALRAEPDSGEWLNASGIVAVQKGQPAAAKKLFARAAALPQPHFGALQNLAGLLAREGRHEDAIREYRRHYELFGQPQTLQQIAEIERRQALADEEKRLEKLTRTHPGEASWVTLGNHLYSSGQPQQALEAYRKALKSNAASFAALYNIGNIHYAQANKDKAAQAYRRCIELKPSAKEARARLADVLADLGQFEEAAAQARQALAIDPGFAHARNALGNALKGMGQLDEAAAALSEVIRLHPNPVSIINLAAVFEAQERQEECIELLRSGIKNYPKVAEFYASLCNLHIRRKEYGDAVETARKGIAELPNHAGTVFAYAKALSKTITADSEEVVDMAKRAVELAPGHLEAWLLLSSEYRVIGDSELALRAILAAQQIDPKSRDVFEELGEVYAARGDFDKAKDVLRAGLAAYPRDPGMLCSIAVNCRLAKSEPEIAVMQELVAEAALPPATLANLHHALAKIADKEGDYGQCVSHMMRNKTLRAMSFDLAKHRDNYAQMKEAFGRDYFAALPKGQPDNRPVFVIGMPRCGSTLTETIMSSHPEVTGLGEIPHLRNVGRGMGLGQLNAAELSARVRNADPQLLDAARAEYLRVYRRHPHAFSRYVDKNLHNFELVWLIAALFPGAKIVHCMRDPVDTCLSIFQQNFSEFHSYSKDLRTLGEYYRTYEDLMRHWSEVADVSIFNLSYEALVDDLEGNARKLISHLGLPWNDACLRFHEAERIVETASRWQVRQGLYSSSKKKWKKYEPYITELIEALETEKNG